MIESDSGLRGSKCKGIKLLQMDEPFFWVFSAQNNTLRKYHGPKFDHLVKSSLVENV